MTGNGKRGLAGEDHGRAKLTADQVRQIRRLAKASVVVKRRDEMGRQYPTKAWNSVTLAARFRVSPGQIRKILRRELWASL